MRWVAGGPDIPTDVLQCLEEGDLVFFCGAGVSCRAGLPSFKGLVEQVYSELNEKRRGQEEDEFERRNFDRVLGLLEARLQLGRKRVRGAVRKLLQLSPSADLRTHKALLALSTDKEGACRLVTTNFDPAFEPADSRIPVDAAPKLPIPKKQRWRGIVHLHGRISDEGPEGETLVLTSADFGLAYLTERWASRFVSELFRRFSVLFVGYSVDDPVMRYMMDALAADRALGESVGKAYTLVASKEGQDETVASEWRAKGVVPILYDQRDDDHTLLHQTLGIWADCHRLGLLGRESVIAQHAGARPTRPYEDERVSQVIWAIQEPSGHLARVFAEHEPLPPAEWLEVFEEVEVFERQKLLKLPSPDAEKRPVPLGGSGLPAASPPPLSPVTAALGDWLTRHLDSPRVQHWAIDTGGCLHPAMRFMLRRRLQEPACTLPPSLRLFWRVVSSGLCRGDPQYRNEAYDLARRLKTGPWDSLIKDELLSALTPYVRLNRPWPTDLFETGAAPAEPLRLESYTDAEVVLHAGDQGVWLLQALRESPNQAEILSELLDDVTTLLKRAMELHALLGHASEQYDRSHWDQPSIAPDSQNRLFRNWVVLIELTRDSWQATASADPAQARRQVDRWKSFGFPVFRRLILHAMAQPSLFTPDESLDYLLEDDGRWLWSSCTKREMFRLLHSLWPRLGEPGASRLLDSVLPGPPRSLYGPDVSDDDYAWHRDRHTWLLLEKLRQFAGDLPSRAAEALEALRAKYPDWRLHDDDRDEFTSWMEARAGEWPPSPPVSRECLEWPDEVWVQKLASTTERELLMRSWRLLLSEQFDRAVGLLVRLAQIDCWPSDAWETLLEFSALKTRWQDSCQGLSLTLAQAPEQVVQALVPEAARWLHYVSESSPNEAQAAYWPLWDRVAEPAFARSETQASDPLDSAWNSPAGHLTEALLNRISLARPQQRADLPAGIWEKLDRLVTGAGGSYPTARVLLASRLALLHDLDASWVETGMIWRFDWDRSEEAAALWLGFLWEPQLNPDLWNLLKPSFLKTAEHTHELGGHAGQLHGLAAAICVRYPGWISEDESKAILESIGVEGRKTVAVEIWRWLEGAKERGELLWAERIGPWLTRAWPKDLAFAAPESAEYLALAAIASRAAFASAVDTIEPMLTHGEHYFGLADGLRETQHPEDYPEATLKLLSLTVPADSPWAHRELREVLNRVAQAQPALRGSPQYRALDEFLRRHNLP